ncbi:MAG: Hpt domain-containing protein [Candidatus Cloacimonetes bacterium]|nr:Hpt domain-containing protein [Candidatus Cloacimonadota bacterium]
MDIQEIKELFIEEANEYLSVLENNLKFMQSSLDEVSDDLICETYRAAHSIKGTSAFLALKDISELSKAMEYKMMPWRDKEATPNLKDIKTLLEAYDILKNMIDNLEENKQTDIYNIIKQLNI